MNTVLLPTTHQPKSSPVVTSNFKKGSEIQSSSVFKKRKEGHPAQLFAVTIPKQQTL